MRNFTEAEFACRCGCISKPMDPMFLEMIDLARDYADVPFIITSGYRCEQRNKDVGSTSMNHTSGHAADIACQYGTIRLRIVMALIKAGFRRIGLHKSFIHCDNMQAVDSIWLY